MLNIVLTKVITCLGFPSYGSQLSLSANVIYTPKEGCGVHLFGFCKLWSLSTRWGFIGRVADGPELESAKGVLLSVPTRRALALLMLRWSVLVAKVSAFFPGMLAKRTAGHSWTRLWSKMEVDTSPAWGSSLVRACGQTSCFRSRGLPMFQELSARASFVPTMLNCSVFQLYRYIM